MSSPVHIHLCFLVTHLFCPHLFLPCLHLPKPVSSLLFTLSSLIFVFIYLLYHLFFQILIIYIFLLSPITSGREFLILASLSSIIHSAVIFLSSLSLSLLLRPFIHPSFIIYFLIYLPFASQSLIFVSTGKWKSEYFLVLYCGINLLQVSFIYLFLLHDFNLLSQTSSVFLNPRFLL